MPNDLARPSTGFGDTVVRDLMIHDIDILLWLIDASVTSVAAFDTNEAHTIANFEFDDGTVGSLTASRVTQRKVREPQLLRNRVMSKWIISTKRSKYFVTRCQSTSRKTGYPLPTREYRRATDGRQR